VSLRDVRRATLGAVAGATAAAISQSLAGATGQSDPFTVLAVLAVAAVGLLLGGVPAIWAYASAGVVMAALNLPVGPHVVTSGDLVRLLAFGVGSPAVILLTLRAERRHRESLEAHNATVEAERRAGDERIQADTTGELHAALEQVERQRTRLEEVAEAIPEPLIVYDADARGTYGNRAALRIFGRSFFDRPVEEWGRVAEPRDERGRSLPRDEWPQLRARRKAFRSRMLVRLPMSGRDLLVDVEGTPIPDGGAVLLLRDVGKEVDERRRLSRFASFVAHELRNPLAVAKARIELANRQAVASGRSQVHGERALESVDAAIGILERLELFSRAEAGRLEASVERFDLRAAVDAGIERLRARGSDREVRVTAVGDPLVSGDRPLTEQAITNLLTNADRYSEPDAPVEIEIDARDTPLLRVRDAGPGIPDDVADILFRERVSSGRGLGLGLFLVNAAMQAQGGSVQLEERRPRAAFVLHWPRGAAAGNGIEAEPAAVDG
jgi:signal transduction histidine kinase